MHFDDPAKMSDDQLTAEIERLELEVVAAHATYPITWVREIECALGRAMQERTARPRIRKFVIYDGGLEELIQAAFEFEGMTSPDELDELERNLFHQRRAQEPEYESFGPTTDAEQKALEERIHGRRPA